MFITHVGLANLFFLVIFPEMLFVNKIRPS